ncbi:MAG: carbamoyltransferase HypF, partial [Methylococcales bacterium]|nr:carbamoyltransferase HypF [Methylococcales bacterium]
MDKLTKRIIVDGHVQGVGFRPFIYRLAHQYQMHGWVVNLTGIVEIVIEGAEPNVISFIDGIISQAPPLAEPRIIEESEFPALIN